jgi:hypothetical protein
MHPYWERTENGLTGWVVTRPTPLKRSSLRHSPFVSCSYWDPAHDVAVAECAAEWETDPDERALDDPQYCLENDIFFDFHIYPVLS